METCVHLINSVLYITIYLEYGVLRTCVQREYPSILVQQLTEIHEILNTRNRYGVDLLLQSYSVVEPCLYM